MTRFTAQDRWKVLANWISQVARTYGSWKVEINETLLGNLNTSKNVETPQLQVPPAKYKEASSLNMYWIEIIFEFLEKWKLVRQLHHILQ